jgi:hypothetical protein
MFKQYTEVVCNKHVYELHANAYCVAKEKQHGDEAKVEVMSASAISVSGFALYTRSIQQTRRNM